MVPIMQSIRRTNKAVWCILQTKIKILKRKLLVFSSFIQGLEKFRATHKKYPRVVNIKP